MAFLADHGRHHDFSASLEFTDSERVRSGVVLPLTHPVGTDLGLVEHDQVIALAKFATLPEVSDALSRTMLLK